MTSTPDRKPPALILSAILVGLILGLSPVVVVADAAEAGISGTILDQVQQARERAGVARLERRPDLDSVALELAREVARRPQDQRLVARRPVSDTLEQAGIREFRRATTHLGLEKGGADLATAFLSTWYGYDGWKTAISDEWDSVGAAVVAADDGWAVLVTVLVKTTSWPTDLRALEREAIEQVNHVRIERSLRPLVVNRKLARVARAHSRDMAGRQYFAHRSPEGHDVEHRVRPTGMKWTRLGENLQANNEWEDPVGSAVRSWLASPGHRDNMLASDYSQTGVGVAIDEQGEVYFTQLFMTP